MNKTLYSALVAGTAALAVGLGAGSANAATASATATARIVTPITIAQNAGLNFGTIVPGAAASTVAIDLTNGKTCGAGLTCSGASTSGAFTATGTGGMVVTIATDATTSLSDGGVNTMSVTAISPSAATATLSVGATGTATFTTRATLNVGATQAAGVYSGNYNVNVNYQ